MSQCHTCGKSILFGGRTVDGYRYCGASCARVHPLHRAAERVPTDVAQKYAEHWRAGPCPRCKQQQGPVDSHAHHRVHSFLVMTQWKTQRSICCRRCARRDQVGSTLYSATLGWWGFPWGLVITPIQLVRNITEICRSEPAQPSADFQRVVRLHLAKQQLQATSSN